MSYVFQPLYDVTESFFIPRGMEQELSKYDGKKVPPAFAADFKDATGISDTTKVREVYEKVRDSIGIIDKEYIVDPTSSFARSLQCVCLPGITSYLALYRNILNAIRNCFNTILLTGDGSPGMCRAVLSQYICDLLVDFINCFVKKYNKGFKFREKPGSIGNFLGALTQAGSSVQQSISNRYGKSGLFRSMFNERKLINSICLFAFTGTWNVDFNAMLEEDITTEIDSIGALYPCTRRFMSYNPKSSPPGLTSYVYSYAGIIVAGWDLNYGVKLVCSDDYSCDGPCDCVQIGKKELPLRAGIGMLRKGETAQFEEYQKIHNSPYRYDKAILYWKSTDSNRTGQVVCKIKEKGKPPSTCNLDIATGRFRCGYDLLTENWVQFVNEPRVLYPEKQDRFIAGDEIKFIADIQLQVPDEQGYTPDRYTKTIYLTIKRDDGKTIYNEKAGEIEIEGTTSYIFPEKGFRLTEDMFTKPKSTISCIKIGKIDIGNIKNKKLGLTNNELSTDGLKGICNKDMLIYYDGNNYYYVTGTYNEEKKETKEFDVDEKYKENENKGEKCDIRNNFVYCGKIKFEKPTNPQKGSFVIFKSESRTIGQEICDSQVHQWTAIIEIRDHDEEGNVLEQISQSYSGRVQKRIIRFNVACKKPESYNTGEEENKENNKKGDSSSDKNNNGDRYIA